MNPYTGLDAPDTYDYIKQSPLKTMDNNFGQMTLGQGRHRGVSFLFFWGWWKSGEALSTHPIYIYLFQLETSLEKIAAKWYLPVSQCTLGNQASQHLETNYHSFH